MKTTSAGSEGSRGRFAILPAFGRKKPTALYDSDRNGLSMLSGNELSLDGSFEVKEICDIIHAEKARVLANYQSDFYAGTPALTVNDFGKGHAYYIAARTGADFLDAFYGKLADSLSLKKTVCAQLPEGVSAEARTDGESDFVFLMNFSEDEKSVDIKSPARIS